MKEITVNIGDSVNNCTVVNIDRTGKDTKVIVRCNECGREIHVLKYKFVNGKFGCNHGIKVSNPQLYEGKTFGNIMLKQYLGR